jgi:hypothetical protein
MGTDATRERQQAHAPLDKLPQEKLTAVVHLLQAISDLLARSLANAPIDDAPTSAEEMLSKRPGNGSRIASPFPTNKCLPSSLSLSLSKISNAWAGPLLTLAAKAIMMGKKIAWTDPARADLRAFRPLICNSSPNCVHLSVHIGGDICPQLR